MTVGADWYQDPAQPHLLRWWDGAQWTDHTSYPPVAAPMYAYAPPPTHPRRTRPWAWIAGGIAVLMVLYALAVPVMRKHQVPLVEDATHPGRLSPAIAGAPGYATFFGPNGRPLAVGQPWGRRCQPVRIQVDRSVPRELVAQLQAAVSEARRAGINIVVSAPDGRWMYDWLYYPPGVAPRDVVQADVFADAAPPFPRDGKPELVNLGWDASLDADRRHEHLTHTSATIHLSSAGTDFDRRRAGHFIVALVSGVNFGPAPASALRSATTADALTGDDIAALRLMSGCGTDAIRPLAKPMAPLPHA